MADITTDAGSFIVDNPEIILDLIKSDIKALGEFEVFTACFNTYPDLTMAEHTQNIRYASRLMAAIERAAKAEIDRLEATK